MLRPSSMGVVQRRRAMLAVLAMLGGTTQCFHRFEDPAVKRTEGSAADAGAAGAGEPAGGSQGGGSGGGTGAGHGGSDATGGSAAATGGSGGTPGSAGTVPEGGAGNGGSAAEEGAGRGGSLPKGGAGQGGSVTTGGASTGGGSGSGGTETGASGAGAGGEGSGSEPRPQCEQSSTGLRVVFEDDFERYSLEPPYDQADSPWIQADEGRTGTIVGWGANSGARSFQLDSLTIRSEIAYVALELAGAPRRLVLELWYAPESDDVYRDFAELGFAVAPTKFDLRPTVAFEVNDHVLELRKAPEKPIASSNGQEPYEPAVKPPFVALFEEVDHASDASVVNYLRLELDYCSDLVSAYVGADSSAPLVGTGTFDGTRVPTVAYLAGGLSTTYIDDFRVLADDE